MKRIYTPAALGLALLFTAVEAYPQQAAAQAGPQRYTQVISLKVPADKEAAFVEFYTTGAGSKVVNARMKANAKATAWSLRRAVYAGDPLPAANFLIVTGTIGAPEEPDPAKRDELYRAASGMTYTEYMQKVRAMSETVGTTLSHTHHLTPGYKLAAGDYMLSTRLKAAEGKTTDLYNLMRDIQFPLAAERVKAGRNLKGWAFGHLVFPSGNSLRYDATVTSVYKDLASAVGGPGTGGGAAAMANFAKLFPDRSYTRYTDDARAFSKVVRTELFRVVVAVQPEGR